MPRNPLSQRKEMATQKKPALRQALAPFARAKWGGYA